ncbi:MAG: T9SS C-terminal target domain-containing protein [Haliscomenobacteraceae bacterium CHB4]|nr:hypothetical protein [Saprospiraceae bacterium]MCE7922161.1 T9SS C-terminal target domain-containing protein [Haliscomenobacteraceae bacterium CHB4]
MKNTLCPPPRNFKLIVLATLLSLQFFSTLTAQTTLFQVSNLTKTDLTGSKLASFEKLESGDYTAALWIVEGVNFTQQADDGYLEISVPGNDTVRSYKAKFVEAEPNGNMTWFGESLVSPDHWGYGYASFIIHNGDLLGHFTTETGAYSLHSIDDGKYVLVEYDDDGLMPICGMQVPGGDDEYNNQFDMPHLTQGRGSNCDVKVLILYTSAALAKAEDISLGVNNFIAQANQILSNSAVYPSQLRFFLAGHELLSGFTETGDIGDDLDALTGPTSLAHARRDALNADCVVLLTAGDYDNALGLTPSCGPTENGAFSIVQIDAAGPWKTFTHELGHQFGCKHSVGNNNGNCEPVTEQPHWFRCGGRDRYTVMEAGIPKAKDRIPHFSNPNIKYHDHDTGTATRDNAAWLRSTACTVSGYRISEDMNAYISGESQVCISKTSDPAGFVAVASGGGPGPYSYAWQVAINGYTYGPVLSTTDVLTLDLSAKQPGDVVFIRVTVTSAYQQVVYAYFSVFIIEDTPECLYTKPLETHETLKDVFSFQVQPNPADREVIVLLNAKENSLATIELLSSFGQVFNSTFQKIKSNESVEVPIQTSGLPTGTYLLRVTSGDNTEVKKVTIVH